LAASAAGAVRVRPIGLSAPAAMKRYQYQRSGASPFASTWIECPQSGSASVSPERTMDRIESSLAISQRTRTASRSSSAASRVHSTTPSGDG
jgi:hypothetical protein